MPVNNYWVVFISGCMDPELIGPFFTEVGRDTAARDRYVEEGEVDDHFFGRLDIINGEPVISTYVTSELERDGEPEDPDEG